MKSAVNYLITLCFLFGSLTVALSGSTKIAVLTDIHFLSPELASPGKALSLYETTTGRTIEDLQSVLEVVFADILREEIDILLITGDITNHGEQKSHFDFIEKLKPLKEAGIRIFVTPGNHDINIPDAKRYVGDQVLPVQSVTANEFAELYEAFGYNEAISRDAASLSYLAEISDSTWLMSIDTNRYDEHTTTSITGGRIKPETMNWMLDILEEARQRDIVVLGMMHHGLVEHMPFQNTFFSEYLIENWQTISESLADAGLKIIFTGHFHSNDITLRKSARGNIIYDVETASLAHYPFAYRIMSLTNSDLSIDSRFVTEIPINYNLEEEYLNRLEKITFRIAESKLNNLGLPLPPQLKAVLTEMIVKLNLTHVRGDEMVDEEMLELIMSLSAILGNEVEPEEYTLDFPPMDNKLIIEFEPLIYNK